MYRAILPFLADLDSCALWPLGGVVCTAVMNLAGHAALACMCETCRCHPRVPETSTKSQHSQRSCSAMRSVFNWCQSSMPDLQCTDSWQALTPPPLPPPPLLGFVVVLQLQSSLPGSCQGSRLMKNDPARANLVDASHHEVWSQRPSARISRAPLPSKNAQKGAQSY